MFRVIQVDPETLAIHLNAGAIAAHPRGREIFTLLDQVRAGGDILALLTEHPHDISLLDFGSSYLHELRHFADLLLSPFGFYRIRTAFEVFYNLPGLLFNSSERIPIPLMSAMDPITRSILGLGAEFERSQMHRVGQSALTRVQLINLENHFDPSTQTIRYGGDRILEALAYITQFEFLLHRFDAPETRRRFHNFFSPFEGTPFDLAYRWFIPHVHELHPGEVMPNNRLIMPILFASLCGSIPVKVKPSAERKPVVNRDVTDKLPSVRYHQLINHFKSDPRPSLDDSHEAFALVDSACEQLFGLRMTEEIEEDIRHTQDVANMYRESRGSVPREHGMLNPVPLLEELVSYRRSIFSHFKSHPWLYSTSQGFYQNACALLRPSVVYHSPSGWHPHQPPRYSRLHPTWIGLVDRQITPPPTLHANGGTTSYIYAAWCPLPGDNGYSREDQLSLLMADVAKGDGLLSDPVIASRQGVYGVLGPLYRWILYGKRFRSISEVELEAIPQALGIASDKFAIDPFYAEAEDISFPDTFFDFLERDQLICDVCNERVTRTDSYHVSALTVRQNKQLTKHLSDQGPELEFALLRRDWSGWLICRVDMQRFGLPLPPSAD